LETIFLYIYIPTLPRSRPPLPPESFRVGSKLFIIFALQIKVNPLLDILISLLIEYYKIRMPHERITLSVRFARVLVQNDMSITI